MNNSYLDLIDNIVNEVRESSQANSHNIAEVNDFVDDVLDNMEPTIVEEVATEEYIEPLAIEASLDDNAPDSIDCPSCGSIAYWNEDMERYVCSDCGWIQPSLEEQIEESVEIEEAHTTVEQAPISMVNDIINDMDEDLQDIVDSTITTSDALVDDTTIRFKGAPWYEIVQSRTIILAGLGGIGSWLSLFIARMKPKAMFIYDDDIVEAANMSGQLYGVDAFGKTKVQASITMSNNLADYYDVFGNRQRFTEESEASDIMICGFDNMAARKTFYNSWKKRVLNLDPLRRAQCLFLDGRLSAEDMQVFCITGNDAKSMREYESKWLFDDSEADATVCSYKQTTYCAAMIGSLITNLFVNFCTNLGEPVFERPLPFYTTYDAELMQFKIEG